MGWYIKHQWNYNAEKHPYCSLMEGLVWVIFTVYCYKVECCAFCWTSRHTHPVSGVINQILSPICSHLHLRSLFYVWQFKFVWQSVWVCKNCMWDTYTIWRIEVCARPCCSTEGVLLKTQTLSNTPPWGCNAYHRHPAKCTCRFMCSLRTVITASTAHLCSCLCYTLQGVHAWMSVWVKVTESYRGITRISEVKLDQITFLMTYWE